MSTLGENPSAKRAQIEAAIAKILADTSGFDFRELDKSATFLELGFDSLFLIQLSQLIRNQLKAQVTFRQMIEDVTTIDALISHLTAQVEDHLPTEAEAPAPLPSTPPSSDQPTGLSTQSVDSGTPASAISPSASQASGSPPHAPSPLTPPLVSPETHAGKSKSTNVSGLEQILLQQQQLMAMQLELLQGRQTVVSEPSQEQPQPTASPPTADVRQEEPASIPSAVTIPTSTDEEDARAAAQRKIFERFGPYKPVRRAADMGLTSQQSEHLEQFIQRYTLRTTKSKEHAQAHRDHFADPRGVAGYRRIWKSMVYQITVDRSQGSKLWDIDGNEYIDIAMGFGLNLFGHSPNFITEALQSQLLRGVEVGPQSPLAGDVAQLLCDFARKDRATFCNTGSEAVMAALRLARTVTGKSKVVFFNKDYHGNFDQVLIRSNLVAGRRKSAPAAPGVPQSFAENALVFDYASQESLDAIAERADEIAAVLIEPVQSADPFIQPREFLHEVRRITHDNNIAMIMDEVITGFRAAQGGAQEWFDVWSDLATYGKVLGGGLPIGALAGNSRYMDALDGGTWKYEDDSEPGADMTFFAGTFVRHPLALAAAHQVLMRLKDEGPELQTDLTQKTTHLVETLNSFFQQELIPIRVAQFSSLFRFMFPPDLEYADMLYFHLLDRGIFTRGWQDNCFLSTAHSTEDIDRIIQAVKDSCLEIRRGGFLPEPDKSGVAVQDPGIEKVRPQSPEPDQPVEQKKFPHRKFPLPKPSWRFGSPPKWAMTPRAPSMNRLRSLCAVISTNKVLPRPYKSSSTDTKQSIYGLESTNRFKR